MARPKRFQTRAEYLRWRYWQNIDKFRKEGRRNSHLWRKKNLKKAREQDRVKRERYKEKKRRYNSNYYKERMKEDLRFRMRHIYSSIISSRLRKRFSGKNCKSSFDYLPYTIDELLFHLENQFKKGMSWNNYGKWHIDHIIPDSAFHYKSPSDEEFRKCWALENLQPLWAKDNILKSNKPFKT